MAKGGDDVRARLQQAALALFGERGYDRTTAAEIAARANVTERTFFRHFADKREVLFDGEGVLRGALTHALAEAPSRLSSIEALFAAFRSVTPLLEANRGFSEPRQAVIAAAPALAERETAKHAALAEALAAALRARGAQELGAALAARAGMAAFTEATLAWLADPTVSLDERLDQALAELRALFAAGGG